MERVWAAIRQTLAENLSENNYKIWIDPLQPLRIDGKFLVLGCPNQFFLNWIRENYQKRINDVLKSVEHQGSPLDKIELEVAAAPPKPRVDPSFAQKQYELPRIETYARRPLRFNPKFTFERFIVGQANQYAYAATQAMAMGRELNTNSLLILSDAGLGKSHLSQALGQHVLTADKRRKVYYLTAEDFTNEMVYSIKNKCTDDFKNKYRCGCDVLVLEEVHFLSGKEKVQNELSYTLDYLAENKKQIVLTSNRLPKDIPRLGRQFASRLSNSLISTIEAPDYNTRVRILEFKARENGMHMRDDVIDFMARRLKKDVRQMESCLNSLSAKSKLLDRPIDLKLVEESMADLVENTNTFAPEEIRELICRNYHITMEDIRSRSRRKDVVLPRNLGMYLCRKMTDLSLQQIGKVFGRNHSTVLYAVNLIENRSRRDPKLKGQVEFLSKQLETKEGGAK